MKGSMKCTLGARAQSQEVEIPLRALLKSERKQAQLVPGRDEYDTSISEAMLVITVIFAHKTGGGKE